MAALSQPRDTLVQAERLLAAATDPWTRSYAGQARGIALRELGDVRAAIGQLKRALVQAGAVDSVRESDVAASLAATLAVAGRNDEALTRLGNALQKVSGVDAARVQVRQGSLLGELGRPLDAARTLHAAARTLRRAGDVVWESRAQLNLAQASIEVGDTTGADVALIRVEELIGDSEQTFESALGLQYRGLVAVLEARIPDALAHLDMAARRYALAGTQSAELSSFRATALLAAGMPTDALRSARDAVEFLRHPGTSPSYRAHALTRAAEAALLADEPDASGKYAREAVRLYRRLSRARGVTLARLVAAQARRASGDRSRRLLREVSGIADEAGRHRMPEALEANLLAGEVALAAGARETAAVHLARARRARNGRSDIGKVLGWRATALGAAGRRATVLKACGAGLDVLEGHQATLGAIEMRAAATTHGLPLAQMAVRAAVESDDSRAVLHWVERWRSTTLRLPPVRLPDDPGLAAALAKLRLTRLRIDEATAEKSAAAALEREVAELETTVRDRTRRMSADGTLPDEAFDVTRALEGLEGATLVDIFELDGQVHVLLADDEKVRHHVAGTVEAAQRAVEFARFSLRRMSHRTFAERARASLPPQAEALQQAILGPAAAGLGVGPVIVVPPASLASAPWGVLPALRQRAVCVAASTASWWAARNALAASDRVALVAGPSLAQATAEIDQLLERYPYASVLRPREATTDAVLRALDGAALAHVAAHGTFRADNPLFSALQLADGPLTVYDLQRLRRAPHRLVLSCCDSGTVSAAGADEVLGLASALVPLGMAGMIAATVPVSDEAAVPFSIGLHDRLRAGASTADALRDARVAARTPAAYAIAHSFTAFGAA